MKKLRKVLEGAFWAGLVVYLLLVVWPEPLYGHAMTVGPFEIRSDHTLDRPEMEAVVAGVVDRLAEERLALPRRPVEVFVSSGRIKFRILSRTSAWALAAYIPLLDHVFIGGHDPATGQVRSDRPRHNQRSFGDALLHETVHLAWAHELGWLRSRRLTWWKKEGYPEYVVGTSSFPEPEGLELLRAGESAPSSSFRYFQARQMVELLIVHEQVSRHELARSHHEHDETLEAVREHLRTP